ncbi:hypothetical protein [Burkholderia sp. S-53]|uniref:hypothetical protein n=1 Tax=Burkholderia sp. S-53 TaxID=2906514 RepID=UPI0021D140F1|nr:hypothetical protein [Burkholderia sp. S-53]UXU90693.1 hypothetical protein LXM88_36020 [Burkholderia sp. S-53]
MPVVGLREDPRQVRYGAVAVAVELRQERFDVVAAGKQDRAEAAFALGVVAQHTYRVGLDRKLAVERRVPAVDVDPVQQAAVAFDHDRRVRVAADERGVDPNLLVPSVEAGTVTCVLRRPAVARSHGRGIHACAGPVPSPAGNAVSP